LINTNHPAVKPNRHGGPILSCIDYPSDGNKVVKDLKTALKKAGLKDGMTISTHHHLRNGDALPIFCLIH
jgi:citrate lyase subunit alpha / citrate CoA-transferase